MSRVSVGLIIPSSHSRAVEYKAVDCDSISAFRDECCAGSLPNYVVCQIQPLGETCGDALRHRGHHFRQLSGSHDRDFRVLHICLARQPRMGGTEYLPATSTGTSESTANGLSDMEASLNKAHTARPAIPAVTGQNNPEQPLTGVAHKRTIVSGTKTTAHNDSQLRDIGTSD